MNLSRCCFVFVFGVGVGIEGRCCWYCFQIQKKTYTILALNYFALSKTPTKIRRKRSPGPESANANPPSLPTKKIQNQAHAAPRYRAIGIQRARRQEKKIIKLNTHGSNRSTRTKRLLLAAILTKENI